MSKFVVVTGGVVSSLGKGITSASIGFLLKSRGYKVDMLKFDPYLNVDPGTMSPLQHGEVFVTLDGAETDLDLGHYERFMSQDMSIANNVTAGQIYQAIIAKERRGDFLGKTVQVIPHITNEIKDRIKLLSKNADIVVIEIGGTVGDIEGLPFLEAVRELRYDFNREDVIFIHLVLVPSISPSKEIKTKPAQHSVMKLREIGIDPDLIICRSEKDLSKDIKEKIALFCGVEKNAVISEPNVKNSIYEVPIALHKQDVDLFTLKYLRMKSPKADLAHWQMMLKKMTGSGPAVKIGIAGKYTQVKDAYKSIFEALNHAACKNARKLQLRYIDVDSNSATKEAGSCDGILVPGGFGERGIEGKIQIIRFVREKNIPFLGICLGMQCAVIEFARNVLGLKSANSSEFSRTTPHPVIDYMSEQKKLSEKGGTMRLGGYKCRIKQRTKTWDCYKKDTTVERHRHRLEFNNKYRENFESKGLVISAVNTEKDLVEVVELKNHKWFIAAQFHPEFQSSLINPHPLFNGFIKASTKRK